MSRDETMVTANGIAKATLEKLGPVVADLKTKCEGLNYLLYNVQERGKAPVANNEEWRLSELLRAVEDLEEIMERINKVRPK